jgi:hypothetical protein
VDVKRGNVAGMNRLSLAALGLVIANAAVFVAGFGMAHGSEWLVELTFLGCFVLATALILKREPVAELKYENIAP